MNLVVTTAECNWNLQRMAIPYHPNGRTAVAADPERKIPTIEFAPRSLRRGSIDKRVRSEVAQKVLSLPFVMHQIEALAIVLSLRLLLRNYE